MTHISPEPLPATWSEVMARPTWPPTSRTPGSARISAAARLVMRCISGSDVLGVASQWTTSSRSLKVGRSAALRNGSTASPTTTKPASVISAGRGVRNRRVSAPVVAAAARRAAPCSPDPRGGREYSTSPSAGVTVSATTSDAITARP